MNRIHTVLRPALALTVAVVFAACFADENNDVLGPEVTGDKSIFQSYVALGNSITAGFQSSGINDSTQRRSYAVLLAGQMGVRFAYPSLAGRGCFPPVNNFQTQARQGTGSTSTTCDLRNATTVTDILNNVAVPGARVADLTAASGTVNSNTLTSLFLGGKTQVAKALEAEPTFASVFVGGNDVLGAAATGFLVPVTGVTTGVTATTAFATSFDAAVDGLIAGAPGLKGILVGVPKVTTIPLFFAVGVLQASPAFLGGFDQASGRVAASTDPFKSAALTIDANCGGAAAATLISFPIAPRIAQFRNDTNATGQPPKPATSRAGHPPYIACGVSTTPGAPPAPVGDAFILDLTEQASIATTTDAYNTYISSKANTLGWAYMNPNVLLDSIRAAGGVPVAPNLASTNATFGAWFTLDGFHPSNLTHRALTNHIINAINAKYSTNLLRITVP